GRRAHADVETVVPLQRRLRRGRSSRGRREALLRERETNAWGPRRGERQYTGRSSTTAIVSPGHRRSSPSAATAAARSADNLTDRSGSKRSVSGSRTIAAGLSRRLRNSAKLLATLGPSEGSIGSVMSAPCATQPSASSSMRRLSSGISNALRSLFELALGEGR